MVTARRFVHLPEPLPDEPLYGVVARHAAHLGLDNRTGLSVTLFGTAQLPSVDLPCKLDSFARATLPSLGMSGSDCVGRLTAFPYASRHLPPLERASLASALRVGGVGNVHNIFGLSSSRVRVPQFLRVCPECVVAQRTAHGEAHWTRTHQLPGVFCCPDHGRWLVDTSVPYRSSGSREYRDAETVVDQAIATADRTRPGGPFLRLARRCAEALRAAPPGVEGSSGMLVLRERCAEPGRGAAVCRRFVDVVGSELLERCGCAMEPDAPSNWVVNLIRRPGRGHHPLQHLLLEEFASEVGSIGSETGPRPRRGRPHRPSNLRAEEVPDLRRRWTRALDQAPERSRLVAARVCRPVYERLQILDPEWLFSEPPRSNRRPDNQRRVDWEARDEEWALLLRDAARSLEARRPLVRLTRAALFEEAGLSRGTSSCLARLPRCQEAIGHSVETTDAFHVRLLGHAADVASGAGAHELRRVTKLTGPLGPAAQKALATFTRRITPPVQAP